MEVPLLSARDLEDELRLIHRTKRRTLTTVVYGRSDAPRVTVELAGQPHTFAVWPASSELSLRRALVKGEAPVVILVDFEASQLPVDVMGRIASGRVHAVERSRRLLRLFGASSASSALLACRPLVDALLDRGGVMPPLAGPTVDRDTAWRSLLWREAGIPAEGSLSEERLLAHVAAYPFRGAFAALLERNDGALRRELVGWLEGSVGPVAPIAWSAWEKGRGRFAAALAVVLHVAAPKLGAREYLRAQLRHALGELGSELRALVTSGLATLERWGALGPGMLRRLSDEVADGVLGEADRVLADEEVRDVVAESPDLPRAFAASKERLGAAFAEHATRPSLATFEVVVSEAARLREHRLASRQAFEELLGRVRMASRLAAYLLVRPDLDAARQDHGLHGEMLALAEHHASQGGYLDWARRTARGPSGGVLEQGIDALVAAVDALRDTYDARFAEGLSTWAERGARSSRVLPIEDVLHQMAADFLRERPYRRLLVLVLDGMAWANAAELLTGLDEHRYGPLAWGGAPRPVLAALPTITSVSRAALFAGKRPGPGEPEDTSKDPARFAAHKELVKVVGKAPTLLLRPDVETRAGDLSERALRLVGSDERVVALVLNAIDDQLKGSAQVRVAWEPRSIKPLLPLLEAASVADRAVLLVADHGHVLRAREATPSPHEGIGKRWRALGEGESPAAGEIAVTGERQWRPRGRAKVAMLVRETAAYSASGSAGEHGGASLAEVIAPAVLVAHQELLRRIEASEGVEDPALAVRAFPRPAWWDLAVPGRRNEPKAAPPRAASPAPAQPKTKQLEIPLLAAPTGVAAREPIPTSTSAAAVREALGRSKLFQELASTRGKPKPALFERIAILLDAGGVLVDDRFAEAAGLLRRQTAGALAELGEWLNVDTCQVAYYSHASREARLDVALYRSLFLES
jgi:hypothetical protein